MEEKYLDERFKGLTMTMNAQFQAMDTKLNLIHEQTKKTNGRVTEVENDYYKFKESVNHTIDIRATECPALPIINKKIEVVNAKADDMAKKYEDLNFILKYPKLTVAAIVVVVVLSLATFFSVELNPSFKKPATTEVVAQPPKI